MRSNTCTLSHWVDNHQAITHQRFINYLDKSHFCLLLFLGLAPATHEAIAANLLVSGLLYWCTCRPISVPCGLSSLLIGWLSLILASDWSLLITHHNLLCLTFPRVITCECLSLSIFCSIPLIIISDEYLGGITHSSPIITMTVDGGIPVLS